MARQQHYVAILSMQPLVKIPVAHGATAMAVSGGITYCSTVLPWATCGGEPVWQGSNLEDKMRNALQCLLPDLWRPHLVWGGDWNQNLIGGWENIGTKTGQQMLHEAIEDLHLRAPTAELLHQNGLSHSIDHIAVPCTWTVFKVERTKAKRLSDHDAYVVEAKGEVGTAA